MAGIEGRRDQSWKASIRQYWESGYCRGMPVTTDLGPVRAQIDALAIDPAASADEALDVRGNVVFQIYDVPLRSGPLSELCRDRSIARGATDLLGAESAIGWALMLNKVADNQSNWEVPWHQDTSAYCISSPSDAIGERRGGYATFRPHDNMVGSLIAARVALDADTRESGCLFVLPGSQRLGNQWPDGGKRLADQEGVRVELQPGEVLFFNPLIMHRAEPSQATAQRRVVQIYFRPTGLSLPGGARWIDWTTTAR
jgi:ectoine hydroxylase-related dioxygenase (phytanoyl-CoA dioxygenase family)